VPSWRPLTWVVLVVQALFVIWLVAGVNAASSGSDCSASSYRDSCEAGQTIGTGIAIGIVIFLWALVDVILGVVWLVTNKSKRACPACGRNVKKGLIICSACGFDFAAAAKGQAGGPQGQYLPHPPPPPHQPRG
jgi:hypothetical protein